MVIDTPVASIGIRGTQIGIDISDGQNLSVVMMREADGYVGEVFIRNEAGVQVMNEVNHVLFTSAYGQAPVFKDPVNDADIVRMFESTLAHLPQTTGQANDYSTQDAEGGRELNEFVTDAGETVEEEATPPEEIIRVREEEYTSPPLTEPASVPPAEPPTKSLEPLNEERVSPPAQEDRDDATPITTEPFASAGIVVAPNVAPTASDHAVTTSEDQPVNGQLTATDADQTLSLALAEDGAPGNGSVTINSDGATPICRPPNFPERTASPTLFPTAKAAPQRQWYPLTWVRCPMFLCSMCRRFLARRTQPLLWLSRPMCRARRSFLKSPYLACPRGPLSVQAQTTATALGASAATI